MEIKSVKFSRVNLLGILLILSIGTSLFAYQMDFRKIPHKDHYGNEALYVIPNYYFFWQVHTHPRTPWDYHSRYESLGQNNMFLIQGIRPDIFQGHPPFFIFLLSFTKARVNYTIEKETFQKRGYLSLSDGAVYISKDTGPSEIRLERINSDGSIIESRFIGDTRKIAVLFGGLLILLVYLVVRDLYGKQQGILASAFVAFLPFSREWIQMADAETVLTPIVLLSIIFYEKAFRNLNPKDFLIGGTTLGLALGTKFTAFAFFPILFVSAYLINKELLKEKWFYGSFALSIVVLSFFSNPIKAFAEVIRPSEVKVEGLSQYLAGLNIYLIVIFVLIVTMLVSYRWELNNADKIFLVWLGFFSFMPFMVSYRTLIILPPLAIYFSKITFLITRKRTNKKEKYVKRAIQKHDYPKPVFGLVILLFLTAISVGLYFNYKESDAPENIWYLKGWWMLTKEKNYPDASESFERHLMINSSDYDAWNYNGVALGKMNRHDEALKSFENAIRINPNEDSFWFNRGIALWAIGRHSDAIESLDRALELNPQNAQALEIRRAIYE